MASGVQSVRAHILQHVPFEGPGNIASWMAEAGMSASATHFFEKASLPELTAFDLLVILGGPCSVNDETELPWLIAEKQFIRRAIEAGKSVLGVCLGAQLIANAMGAKVYRNREKEIGWFPVAAVPPSAAGETFVLPGSTLAFHWHGETFDLPAGAVHLARSAACEHQAFQLGRRVLGLQFHLETTPASARALVEHCGDELVPGTHVQSDAQILNVDQGVYEGANRVMTDVMNYLVR
jgi:GMP synthase-like glutamine amidotransferase